MSAYESGYTRLVPVPIMAEAQMLDLWAGWSETRVLHELHVALRDTDMRDREALQFLACGIERRLADIEAARV